MFLCQTPLLSDSTWAISIDRDPLKYELTKHVGVNSHFMRSQVQDGVVALQYVPSELQLVDFFIKSQPHAHYQFYLSKLSVVDPPWVWENIRYILVFLLLYFFKGIFIYSPSYIYMSLWPTDKYICIYIYIYIWVSHMNITNITKLWFSVSWNVQPPVTWLIIV
jgi:hypothetical protein